MAKKLILGLKRAFIWRTCIFSIERVKQICAVYLPFNKDK